MNDLLSQCIAVCNLSRRGGFAFFLANCMRRRFVPGNRSSGHRTVQKSMRHLLRVAGVVARLTLPSSSGDCKEFPQFFTVRRLEGWKSGRIQDRLTAIPECAPACRSGAGGAFDVCDIDRRHQSAQALCRSGWAASPFGRRQPPLRRGRCRSSGQTSDRQPASDWPFYRGTRLGSARHFTFLSTAKR